MERQRVHFVYRTTNLVNGKYYIGVHTAWSVDDGYLGSGNRLKRAVCKYGKENFQRVVLWIFSTRDEAYRMEADEVGRCLGDPLCMNIHPGGEGGWELAVKKRRWLRENDPEWLKRDCATRSKIMKERWATGAAGLVPVDWTGRSHSEETKRKIRDSRSGIGTGVTNSQYGTCWITNGIEEKKTRVDAMIGDGWWRGRLRAASSNWQERLPGREEVRDSSSRRSTI